MNIIISWADRRKELYLCLVVIKGLRQKRFIHNRNSVSSLQEAVLQEVGGGGIPGQPSVQTIVIQQIPTKDLGYQCFEGGIPGTILFVIAGGVIGAFVVPVFRKNPVWFGLVGLLVGYLASIVIMSAMFGVEDNDMAFSFDNACDSESVHHDWSISSRAHSCQITDVFRH
ncbi:hypothetical protein HY772_04595 [Candidatus Woesearchaeota archaeon]|nr:hypothetical protein [Candidatus Woesearchaeota archaeon]